MKTRLALPTVAILLIALSGCGGSGDPKVSPTTAGNASAAVEPADSDTGVDADNAAKKYFELLATNEAADAKQAASLAAPGSNAQAYAIYQEAGSQAALDAGDAQSNPAQTTKVIEGGFANCTDDGDCGNYTAIQMADGRIANFNAGDSSLKGRITVGNGKFKPLGDGKIRMVAAYKSITGYVVVQFEIKSGATPLSLGYSAVYRSPNGRQMETDDLTNPDSLAADSLTNVSATFKGADFGGQVTYKVFTDVESTQPFSATFKTG